MEAAELIELGGIPGSDMYEVGEEVGHGTFSEASGRDQAHASPPSRCRICICLLPTTTHHPQKLSHLWCTPTP